MHVAAMKYTFQTALVIRRSSSIDKADSPLPAPSIETGDERCLTGTGRELEAIWPSSFR